MGNISLLDCTLRDGGYVNDWNFGKKAIREIGQKIVQTGIELYEIGFLKNIEYDENKSLFSDVDQIQKMIEPKNAGTKYVAMIDMGAPYRLEHLPKYDSKSVDVFRVIFKKNKIEEAFAYIKEVKEKGYQVFVQPVGTDSYTDLEFVELIQKFNELDPTAFYIVDTFGMIKRKQFLRLVYMADHNLKKSIALGYHSHNNLQQAAGNAEAMAESNMQRDIILDACVFGMGRGAGNLNMELFAEYLNENFDKHYRIEPMLEIIDGYLNDIYSQNFWGYSLPFYLSASNGCHPNYAITYAKKGTLTVKSFHELLKSIDEKDKADFSKENAEFYYKRYQEQYVDDLDACNELKNELEKRKILILAPGHSLNVERDKIMHYIKEESPIIICTNFYSEDFGCDYIFSSNMRRYQKLESLTNCKKIITSNMKEAIQYDFMLNFSSYSCDRNDILDNSGMMLLNVLTHLGVEEVTLAGFDGYGILNKKNYVNSGLEYSWSDEEMMLRNEYIRSEIQEKKHSLKIVFLTETCYENT